MRAHVWVAWRPLAVCALGCRRSRSPFACVSVWMLSRYDACAFPARRFLHCALSVESTFPADFPVYVVPMEVREPQALASYVRVPSDPCLPRSHTHQARSVPRPAACLLRACHAFPRTVVLGAAARPPPGVPSVHPFTNACVHMPACTCGYARVLCHTPCVCLVRVFGACAFARVRMRRYVVMGRLQAQFPTLDFRLVVGLDLVPTLPSWAHAPQLLDHVRFIIVGRPGVDAPDTPSCLPRHYEFLSYEAGAAAGGPTAGAGAGAGAGVAAGSGGGGSGGDRVGPDNTPVPVLATLVSSSEVRGRLLVGGPEGAALVSGLVVREVESSILRYRWYRGGE